MKPYDPKLNPGKTLEETIQNFIEWIRMSNRNTTSVLRSVNEKLGDISRTEENLKDFEASQAVGLEKIDQLLTSLTQIADQTKKHEETKDFASIDALTTQVSDLSDSFRTFREIMESEFVRGMNKIEMAVLEVKSDILEINSQLKIAPKTKELNEIEKNVKEELTKFRSQITCRTEQDKAKILSIIDDLVSDLSLDYLEISGIDLKKRLIEARTQVYEQTEGLAPRFRIMIDRFMSAINDETLYSSKALKPMFIEGISHIREIYHSAPIGH